MLRARVAALGLCALLALSACGGGGDARARAQDAAWNALEPNTSSHDRANWLVVTVEQTTGRAVAERFSGRVAPGCPGPEPPANQAIDPGAAYWYVVFQPKPATPSGTPLSPTAPPFVPEPSVREAQFLVAADGGTVVARHVACVIY